MLLQQKEMIMTYPVKNRLGYDKIGLMYNSCSRLLDPESDRTGAVQLATVNGEGGVSSMTVAVLVEYYTHAEEGGEGGEGGREGGREGWMEGGREGSREGREGGREGGMDGGREGGIEGGREGG